MPDVMGRKIVNIRFRIDGKATEEVKADIYAMLKIIVGNFKNITDIKLIDDTKN
jgi:hypothetical protein